MLISYNSFTKEDRAFWEKCRKFVHSDDEMYPEYMRRIKKRLPTYAPRFLPGDLVFNTFTRTNMKVISVCWDSCPSGISFWRVNVPGVSAEEVHFLSPNSNAITDIFVEIRPNVWRKVSHG